MLDLEFKDRTSALLVIVTIVAVIAIVGTNPLEHSETLSLWSRIGLGAVALCLLCLAWLLPKLLSASAATTSTHPEYDERFQKQQERIADLVPEDLIIADGIIKGIKFDVINGNITDAKAEIIVSSDDNHFTAKGGVAKAILTAAGTSVQADLDRYRRRNFRQGQIAITNGGRLANLAIIHPVVIDLDENRYPDRMIVALLVRRCLSCASALGATSIAFPVIGGGTASKTLKAADSVATIVNTIMSYLANASASEVPLRHVALYVFDKKDAVQLPPNLADLVPV